MVPLSRPGDHFQSEEGVTFVREEGGHFPSEFPDIRTIDIGDLISLGFRPEFSTGYKKIRSHDEYRCFEYKYNLSSSRLFNLQRIIPYLK